MHYHGYLQLGSSSNAERPSGSTVEVAQAVVSAHRPKGAQIESMRGWQRGEFRFLPSFRLFFASVFCGLPLFGCVYMVVVNSDVGRPIRGLEPTSVHKSPS